MKCETVFEGRGLSYRIPVLHAMPDGSIYAFCEARQGTGGDWDPMYLMMRVRMRDGKWGAMCEIAYNNHGPVHNPAVFTVGGDMHLLYGRDYARFYHVSSADGCRTFSEPVDITYVFDRFRSRHAKGGTDWHCIAAGPGGIARLIGGRIVVPVWLGGLVEPHIHAPCQTAVIYSDDDGATWDDGDILDLFDRAPSEAQIVALPEGAPHRAVIVLRNTGEERTRGFAWSDDGIRWSKPYFAPNVREINCQCSLLRMGNMLITTGPEPNGDALFERTRRNLTLHVSSDWGATWSNGQVLNEGISGYSALALDADGNLLCLFETWEDARSMRLEMLTLLPDEITG